MIYQSSLKSLACRNTASCPNVFEYRPEENHSTGGDLANALFDKESYTLSYDDCFNGLYSEICANVTGRVQIKWKLTVFY